MSATNGVVNILSKHGVPETLDRLTAILDSKHIRVFARIDHSGEARAVGLSMRPAQLLIFGNPAAGTPLMIAAPEIAIDLPLKAVAWEDEHGQVWLSYNSPAYLQTRFGISGDLIRNIAGAVGLLEQAAS